VVWCHRSGASLYVGLFTRKWISYRRYDTFQHKYDRSYKGDQIGRIFAHWVIVYFGHLFENYRTSTNFWGTFSLSWGYALILAKNVLGYVLGYFFKNASGHTGCVVRHCTAWNSFFVLGWKVTNRFKICNDLFRSTRINRTRWKKIKCRLKESLPPHLVINTENTIFHHLPPPYKGSEINWKFISTYKRVKPEAHS
jgi:hypothetical protein